MAGGRNVWHGVRKVCCCLPAKDGVLDPVEQEADSVAAASDIHVAPESDGTQVQDLPSQREPQATVVPSEDIQAMYQKHILDLQEDLHTVMKNNQELTCQIIEMGRLVFPELSDCTEVSLLERLKVYLECQLKEKQDLEKRTIRAEKAMLEMEQTVALLRKHFQDTDNHSTQLAGSLEHHPPVSLPSPSPPLTHTPARFFFSKIHKESAEKMMGPYLRNQCARCHGEAITSKQKSVNEGQATIRQGVQPKPGAPSGEQGLLSQVKEKPTDYEQKFPKTMSNLEAEESTRSCWYLPRASADDWTHKRETSSDEQVHRDGGSCLNTQEQDGTNTLPETTPLSTRSKEYHGILKNPSANPEAHAEGPVLEGLALPNEGKNESKGEEVVKGKEKKGSANGNPMGFIDRTVSQKPNVLELGASGAKTTTRWNVQVTHPVVGDPVGDDLRSTRSLSACFVHQSDNTIHLESRTSRSLSPKQGLYSNLGLLQKNQEDFPPLPVLSVSAADKEESSLPESAFQERRADLLHTSTKSLKIQTATKENTHLKGPSAFGKAKGELCISTKDNPVVAVLVGSETGELQPSSSGVAALTSHHTKFPLPSLSAPANTEDLTEEGSLGLEIFL